MIRQRRFRGLTIKAMMVSAWALFLAWCYAKKKKPVLESFTKDNLSWADFIAVKCKGCDCALLMQWLACMLSRRGSCGAWNVLRDIKVPVPVAKLIMEFIGPDELDDCTRLCLQFDRLLITLARAQGLWLSEPDRLVAEHACTHAMAQYAKLAVQHEARKLFHVKPKAHAMCHIALDLSMQPCPNFWLDTC